MRNTFSFMTATEILFGRGQGAEVPARVAALGRATPADTVRASRASASSILLQSSSGAGAARTSSTVER